VRDTRDGKDYDATWGKRMTGEGPYAVLLQQRFQKACERLGLNKQKAVLRTDLFVPPQPEERQMSLF
jgi:DNA repair photolyase